MLMHEVMTSPNIAAKLTDETNQIFLPYVKEMVAKSNLNAAQKGYAPGKETPFADFLSQKYKVNQTDNNKPTTLNQNNTTDTVNVVETRAKSRQKLALLPQNDLEVPETPDKEKIVDPSN
uniref:Uncharacterized protein n=1 Tax=Romanomermis culicivorax TaxID=13658 RepID=A0A915JZN1_ROMCU